LRQVFHLEPRHPHRHAQVFHFLAAGDNAAVVVAQHNERDALKPRLEDALARAVEVVDVDQCDHRTLRKHRVTTPHTSSVSPSFNVYGVKRGLSGMSATLPWISPMRLIVSSAFTIATTIEPFFAARARSTMISSPSCTVENIE